MDLKTVLERRKSRPITPYNSSSWERLLRYHDLLDRYPDIPLGLRAGFNLHLPLLHSTQTPPNSISVLQYHEAFSAILSRELHTGRYIGPFTRLQLLDALGPFQSSPISIIPKAGKAGKYRVIQNFSFPDTPSLVHPIPSINSTVNSDDFPCTWGTFNTVCTIIRGLPPGSQGATRDVAEAYRTVPLHYSQWPATVVRLSEDAFCIDTCTAFGMGPSAGVYGHVADAGVDLLRAQGLGPLVKWVDDHLFFRIRTEHLITYNHQRSLVHACLARAGQLQNGGRLWYKGDEFSDGSFDEFAEDCGFPLRDLSHSSVRSHESDSEFAFAFCDIDRASSDLDIPWEPTKDNPFSFQVVYIGLLWCLVSLTVALAEGKKEKYSAAITTWSLEPTHVLLDVQKLHGKLLHACLVLPAGRAYLTSLESMLGVCSASPFMPHHSVRHLDEDLKWWSNQLSLPFVGRSIPHPVRLVDARAFSDASSTVGVGIVIDGHWRAWYLRPGWQTLDGERDIGWAEAVGFELLVNALLQAYAGSSESHFKVHCDNKGVVDGWRNGRSRNRATNLVFRRIQHLLDSQDNFSSFHLRYVPSQDNPADEPSRGIFPSTHLLLPPIPLPGDLGKFLVSAI